MVENEFQIANKSNRNFTETGPKLAGVIPIGVPNLEAIVNKNYPSFNFQKVDELEVLDILENLKEKKESWGDGPTSCKTS